MGKSGETEIARWLMGRGLNILPIYEVSQGNYKGPTIYAADGRTIIAPDLLAFSGQKIIWFEAKHKNAFTWFRKKQIFETGIDLHHYEEYQRVSYLVEWPIWLLFLHRGGQAKDSPPSPSGLYGNELIRLTKTESHRDMNHGPTGMVYWAKHSLIKLASYPLKSEI